MIQIMKETTAGNMLVYEVGCLEVRIVEFPTMYEASVGIKDRSVYLGMFRVHKNDEENLDDFVNLVTAVLERDMDGYIYELRKLMSKNKKRKRRVHK